MRFCILGNLGMPLTLPPSCCSSRVYHGLYLHLSSSPGRHGVGLLTPERRHVNVLVSDFSSGSSFTQGMNKMASVAHRLAIIVYLPLHGVTLCLISVLVGRRVLRQTSRPFGYLKSLTQCCSWLPCFSLTYRLPPPTYVPASSFQPPPENPALCRADFS